MSANQMATCTTALWTFNSKGQSPCVVGSALAGVCVGGDFTLTPLDPDFVYLGPSVASATSCRCNSVYYSLLSACGACQGNSFIRWSQYDANCTTAYEQVYPQPIPAGIAVPAWAYLDVAAADTFNLTLAQAAGGAESVAIPSATSASSTTKPTGTATGAVSSGTSTKSNAGAIAGGVVGGIVVLALIAFAVFFFLRRRRRARQMPPSALYDGAPINTASPPPPMGYGDGSSTYPSIPSPKPYNPQDPSTFPYNAPYTPPPQNPGSPNYGLIPPNATGQSAQSGYTQANTLVNSPSAPRYTGAPEL